MFGRGGFALLVLASIGGAGVVSCNRSSRGGAASDAGSTTSAATPTEPACKPDTLGAAKLVTPWKPPAACQWRALAAGAKTFVHSEADLIAAALDCQSNHSGIDFTKSTLVVTGHTLSPATVGVDVYDDGAKVTFVSRQRSPCPAESPPMPVTIPLAFEIPAGTTRTFVEATCKQDVKCP